MAANVLHIKRLLTKKKISEKIKNYLNKYGIETSYTLRKIEKKTIKQKVIQTKDHGL